ncbi:MAG: hypothetical protein NXI32_26940 [bacterium]|nr:hypothetical protein [bacterium]
MDSRKLIVGIVAIVLLIWGPLDHSWPWWFAIRTGYLILVPLSIWFFLGWLKKDWQLDPDLDDVRMEAIKPLGIASAAAVAFWYWFAPLYVELQISIYGLEAKATIVKVETVERDDGDRAWWTADLINYTFRTADGYVFAGVNDANSSQTHNIIGRSDAAGNYPSATVQYVRSNPEWHRLKGWGYDGFGPPNSIFNILARMAGVGGLIGFAYWYAYSSLFRRLHANRVPSPRR